MLLQSPSLPALDRARLAEVLRGSSVAPAEFLAEFRRSTELDAASLFEAAQAGDSAQVVRVAHRIEGACRMIGAAGLASACAVLATAGRSGHAVEIGAALESFVETRRALYAFLGVTDPGAAGGDPPAVPGREHAGLCAGLVFLVVEDHDFQRGMIVRQLRQLGALEVHGFADGAAALQAARRPRPAAAIMVLDLAMASLDGIEVARIAGAEDLPLSIILHSAQPEGLLSAQIEQARSCGATVLGALRKPLTADRLAPLVTRHRHLRACMAPGLPGLR